MEQDKIGISKFRMKYSLPVLREVGKKPEYILRQVGGGGVLTTKNPGELIALMKAERYSHCNCGKSLVYGGFNPNSQQETDDVYGK